MSHRIEAGLAPTARFPGPAEGHADPHLLLPARRLSREDASERRSAPPKILIEMRPALDGYAGIPQETRLLFRGLSGLEGFEVEGLIQASRRRLARGTSPAGSRSRFSREHPEAARLDRYSRVVISIAGRPLRSAFDRVRDSIDSRVRMAALTITAALGPRMIRLSEFRTRYFEDFVWRAMFEKTLPASDFDLITSANQRICSVPWHTMHMAGLRTRKLLPTPRYPMLDTSGIEVFIAQTPYPARVSGTTKMVVRYHDAHPVFMPHTISDRAVHQATHFNALRSNVRAGAWFSCVSEASRQDLLRLFPEVAERSVTIHNMVSAHYFREDPDPSQVPEIIRSRLTDGRLDAQLTGIADSGRSARYRRYLNGAPMKYLLIVSTIEPRKNHLRLVSAWETLRTQVDPELKLVIVGSLGWECGEIVRAFRTWMDRGELFMLSNVPAPDLRVLYRHAAATVCPSLGEGFDYSGVEAMRCGGHVIASDIGVHREIYADAAEYFDPYSTPELVDAVKRVLYHRHAHQTRAWLRERGEQVARRYLPEVILPQWQAFLDTIIGTPGASGPRPPAHSTAIAVGQRSGTNKPAASEANHVHPGLPARHSEIA